MKIWGGTYRAARDSGFLRKSRTLRRIAGECCYLNAKKAVGLGDSKAGRMFLKDNFQ